MLLEAAKGRIKKTSSGNPTFKRYLEGKLSVEGNFCLQWMIFQIITLLNTFNVGGEAKGRKTTAKVESCSTDQTPLNLECRSFRKVW